MDMRWEMLKGREEISLLTDGRKCGGWIVEYMYFTAAYLPPARRMECRVNPLRHGQLLGVFSSSDTAKLVTEQARERLKIRSQKTT